MRLRREAAMSVEERLEWLARRVETLEKRMNWTQGFAITALGVAVMVLVFVSLPWG